MNAYELIDLAISIGNRIDVQIGIFITVHLAIFGGIIYVDRPLRFVEKVASIIIYSVFAALNYRLMGKQLMMQESTYGEIAKLFQQPCCQDNLVLQTMAGDFTDGLFQIRFGFLIVSHLLMLVLVILSILMDTSKLRKVDTESPEPGQ